MYAVITPDQLHLPPGAVVRLLGSWQDYQQIRQQRGNTSIPRLKYGSGEILLMSPLPQHGRDAHLIS